MRGNISFTEANIQKLFGHEAAEDEDQDRLRQYYVKGNAFDQVISPLPLRLLVGYKGTGKSALLKVAIAEAEEQDILCVLIQPNDITDLQLDSPDFLFSIRNWTVGLRKIIAQKVLFSVGVRGDNGLPNIESYGNEILEYISDCLIQASQTNCTLKNNKSVDNFLITKRLFVYLDDLDRGWQGKKADIHRLSALLNAVRDISKQNKRGISFKVALRPDVYNLVRTSDESTDKVDGSVIWHTWTNHEIFVLLIKRIETFFDRKVNEAELLNTKQ
jgi:hypothetical protein